MRKQTRPLIIAALLSLVPVAHAEKTGNSFTRADLSTAATLRAYRAALSA